MPKANLLNQMLKHLKGFDKVVNQVKFTKANNGSCIATLKLEDNHLNPIGGLHGGMSATLIDSVSSLGLMTYDTWASPSVSVNINLAYMNSATAGEQITVHSKLLRAGRNMAFLDVELRNAADQVLVKAEHTKFKVGG